MSWPKILRVVGLPALLLGLSGLALGCFYETNDDAVITLLLRGTAAAAPVADLHLYFHGFAWLLSSLYGQWPQLPWYGLLLYTLLYAAMIASFAVLDPLLRARLPARVVAILLVGFFLLALLEHGMWFNYVRVSMLLGGAGALFAAQRARQPWAVALGLLAFGLAWLIRPSAAVLGLAAAAPGALWLGGRRATIVLAGAGIIAILGATAVMLTRSPVAARYRTLDVLKSNLNDYHLYRPDPHTPVDRVGMQAVRQWMLGDSTLVNESLFRRAGRVDVGYFLAQEAPTKLWATLAMLGRDYFPLLLLLGLSWLRVARDRLIPRRRLFWSLQAGMGVLPLLLGVVLKLPPRLALPWLDLWLLGNVAYLLRPGVRRPTPRLTPAALALLLAAGLAYGYKTLHRRQTLTLEAQRGAALLRRCQTGSVGSIIVAAGLEEAFKSQSPFEVYSFGNQKIMFMTGWPALDPSQAGWRRQLTGSREFVHSLVWLAQRRDVSWFLTAETAFLLNHYPLNSTATAPLPVRWTRTDGPTGDPAFYAARVEKVK